MDKDQFKVLAETIKQALPKSPPLNIDPDYPHINYDHLAEAINPDDFEPVTYSDSIERDAVDDLEKRFTALLDQSAREQRRVNTALIIIGALTLAATVAGVILQFVK